MSFNGSVRLDILKLLRLSPPRLKTFTMSFNRPNLHYEVKYKSSNEDPYPALLNMINHFNANRLTRLNRDNKSTSSKYRLMSVDSARPVCGIIYSPRRALCDSVAARLNSDGIVAAAYHAGLDNKEKEKVLHDWVQGERLGVVVATIAFGMGVDRGDVLLLVEILCLTVGTFCYSS